MDAAEPGLRTLGIVAAGRRRHHVPDAAPERRHRRRREDRPHLLDLQAPDAPGFQGVLRRRTTAASRSSATRCSWARSTRISSRSTRAAAACCWNVRVAEHAHGYSVSLAPLVVKDKVIIGVGGGEYGIRGFIAAYDAATGKEAWRFNTIPAPGEPGSETWSGDAWKTGGGSLWVTGTYDPALNLTYWGTGNPGPDFNPAQRPGDNLYTEFGGRARCGHRPAQVAFPVHARRSRTTGTRRRCRCSSTPTWRGAPAKLLMLANRNGFFYVLDRVTGKFLLGKPFVKQNWASGLDENGRPIQTPQPPGATTWPGQQGGTNWYSPSYSPRTGLFYVSAWEDVGGVFRSQESVYKPGGNFMGGGYRATPAVPDAPVPPNIRRPDAQHLDRRRRARGGHRDRSGHRRAQVDVPDVRPDRLRHPDDGIGPVVHRRPRRLLPGARRAHGRAAVEEPASVRCRCCPDRSRIRSTAVSTWRSSAATCSRRSRSGTKTVGDRDWRCSHARASPSHGAHG